MARRFAPQARVKNPCHDLSSENRPKIRSFPSHCDEPLSLSDVKVHLVFTLFSPHGEEGEYEIRPYFACGYHTELATFPTCGFSATLPSDFNHPSMMPDCPSR